jgi:hypothetical protein
MVGAQGALADHNASIYGDYPSPIDRANPYANGLEQARRALDASISQFWAVYYRSPYDYWTVVDAYYAYVNRYYTYRAYLDAYLQWAKNRASFAGHVLTRDLGPGMVAPAIYPPPAFPGTAAHVTLATYVPPGQGRPVQLIGARYTDGQGKFEFTGIKPGTYSFAVQKQGFLLEKGTVEIAHGRLEKTIYMSRTRMLTGTVVTPLLFGAPPPDYHPDRYAPRPVAGARVSITYLNPRGPVIAMVPTHVTSSDGRFHFENIPGTQVKITVEKHGYRTHVQNVDLTGARTDVRVVIFSTLPPPPIVPVRPLGTEAPAASGDLNNPFGQ